MSAERGINMDKRQKACLSYSALICIVCFFMLNSSALPHQLILGLGSVWGGTITLLCVSAVLIQAKRSKIYLINRKSKTQNH